MKKFVLAIAAAIVMIPTLSRAQGKYGADSVNCIKNLSYYSEYYKQKNYADATVNWRRAYKACPPQCSQNLLIHGTNLLKLVANKSKGAARKAVVDSILTLQDQRATYFPKYKVQALNNKGQYIANYIQTEDPGRAHSLYLELISQLGPDANGSIIENDFRAALDLYKSGKMTLEETMAVYSRNVALFDTLRPAKPEDAEANAEAKKNVEGLLINSRIANCDALIKVFTPRLAAEPDNISLIKSIVSMMNSAEDCSSNDLYLKAVTAMDRIEPSAASAYALFRMNAARGNDADALKYLEKAAYATDTPDSERAGYMMDLASLALKNGNKAKAVDAAHKVISLGGKAGAAYMLIGKVWGGTRCGGNEITSRAGAWVAVDYFNKAKNADPSLAAEANRLIGQYSAYFPKASDAFMYDIRAGQSYTVSCGGMTATTTVRTQK
ncbi:MAG: hypothetical protein IJU69_00415 [Bacteroidales bacterium]|nr:hypothetical protein [Bacteroidales bacterium]